MNNSSSSNKIKCEVCPHYCEIPENKVGFCNSRSNIDGEIKSLSYGKITAFSLDPIEKKPLRHFYPGKKILSVGSFGCNLHCGFCQNHKISICGIEADTIYISPEELAEKAGSSLGIAFTYNEPLIGFEYVLDCARLVREKGLKNVIVTNGFICEDILRKLLPYIDAMNIDLKGFTPEFHKEIFSDLETVKNTIEISNEACHVEVTTLVIPGVNDSENEIKEIAKWLSTVNQNIPYHISRFSPYFEYIHVPATDVNKIYSLVEVARRYLTYVYPGNC